MLILNLDLSNKYDDLSFVTYVDQNKWRLFFVFEVNRKSEFKIFCGKESTAPLIFCYRLVFLILFHLTYVFL